MTSFNNPHKMRVIYLLGASVADDKTDIERTLKRQTKCQRFAKLKELQCNRTSRPKLQHI